MKRTVQMGALKKEKTQTLYEVQQRGSKTPFVVATAWSGSHWRYRSKQQAAVKAVELRMTDEHGNQYRVARIRVRKA